MMLSCPVACSTCWWFVASVERLFSAPVARHMCRYIVLCSGRWSYISMRCHMARLPYLLRQLVLCVGSACVLGGLFSVPVACSMHWKFVRWFGNLLYAPAAYPICR